MDDLFVPLTVGAAAVAVLIAGVFRLRARARRKKQEVPSVIYPLF